jgi:hypothetical protein
LDSIKKEWNQESETAFDYSKICYDISNKFYMPSPLLIKNATTINYLDVPTLLNAVRANNNQLLVDAQGTMTIFHAIAEDLYFVAYYIDTNGSPDWMKYTLAEICQFYPPYTGDEALNKMKIVPAEMSAWEYTFDSPNSPASYFLPIPIPKNRGIGMIGTDGDIYDMIVSGNTESDLSGNLEIAVYCGRKLVSNPSALNATSFMYMVSSCMAYLTGHTMRVTQNNFLVDSVVGIMDVMQEEFDLSLRKNMFPKYYFNSVSANTKYLHTIRFLWDGRGGPPDVRSIFVIAQKKFVCRELRCAISADGIGSVIEGDFYPIDTNVPV